MESMGQNLDLDKPVSQNNGEECVEKSSYCSLSQRTSLLLSGGDPTSSRATSVTVVSKRDDEDDDLTLSEGDEQRADIEDEDEPTKVRRTSKKERRRVEKHRSSRAAPHKSHEIGEKLKEELSRYKQELKDYNETTKDLEEKYMKINFELSEMQQKHDHFVNKRSGGQSSDIESEMEYGSTTSIASDAMSLKHKSTKVFSRNSSFMTVLEAQTSNEDLCNKYKNNKSSSNGKKQKTKSSLSAQVRSVYSQHIVETLANRQQHRRNRSLIEEDQENKGSDKTALQEVYNVLKDVINTTQEHKHKHERDRDRDRDRDRERDSGEISQLYTALKSLKSEQLQFRNLIRQQQDRIADYHTRCLKAQDIMKTQKQEIDKLSVNNKQLESSIYHDIDDLRSKIDAKLKNISHLPQKMREEHIKYEKVMRENCLLADKLHELQEEASQLKIKIDELGRRKLVTINRLKAAERDLKIFKNYNSALKSEKRRMADELVTMKEQLESLQANNKRQMKSHRDQSEKQRRDLQKRIFDLELKLSRSQNSTTSLIQERDSLIAELQTQLHTLVHNFEVSQKHIRVLRRHIYSMTASGGGPVAGGAGSAGGGCASSQRGSEAGGAMRACQLAAGSSTSRLSNPRTLKNKS